MPKENKEENKVPADGDEEMENEENSEAEEQDDKVLMKFTMMAKDTSQLRQVAPGSAAHPNPPNLLRRFKINLRLISPSHKNKISTRFQEIDRLYVCKKTKEERAEMGVEFEGFKLVDVYIKSNPHKISQKYGQQFIFSVDSATDGKRTIKPNPDYKEPVIKPEDEEEEETMLDEQKIF